MIEATEQQTSTSSLTKLRNRSDDPSYISVPAIQLRKTIAIQKFHACMHLVLLCCAVGVSGAAAEIRVVQTVFFLFCSNCWANREHCQVASDQFCQLHDATCSYSCTSVCATGNHQETQEAKRNGEHLRGVAQAAFIMKENTAGIRHHASMQRVQVWQAARTARCLIKHVVLQFIHPQNTIQVSNGQWRLVTEQSGMNADRHATIEVVIEFPISFMLACVHVYTIYMFRIVKRKRIAMAHISHNITPSHRHRRIWVMTGATSTM